ncbi:MAG: ornithine carbamoyltransferase [Planctomycetales bacterium]|nr:ornithine carbamoyltransferase [Planctomycetales bacterium]
MRHLLSISDLTREEILRIFALSTDLKAKFLEGVREPLLPGRVMALLFEKPSLRTRVSFEAGMAHLGGTTLVLGSEAGFGHRESIADFTRVLSEMVDVIVVRSKRHATVEEVASHASCSVINGLTDHSHPCQALADLFTLSEHLGSLAGAKLAWVGDANNVARSLALACGRLGVEMVVAAPSDYQFSAAEVARLQSQEPQLQLSLTDDPREAVADATAVYTDVWTSMGQEAEMAERIEAFTPFQLNAKLLSHAANHCKVLHCLPARRGEEITDEVIDGPHSAIMDQAGNRMHAQKGLLLWLAIQHKQLDPAVLESEGIELPLGIS